MKSKESILNHLKVMNLELINKYARENKEILSSAYNQGIINDYLIEEALKVAVISEARRDYKLVTKKDKYPDHVDDYLPYALKIGEFSEEEIKKIDFDHGDNLESFLRTNYNQNLLSELRKTLLNPKAPLDLSHIDPHPACCVH